MALDLTFITPALAIGARVDPGDLSALVALGIRRVVDVRVESAPDPMQMRRHGIAFLHLPTEDRRGVSQAMLDEGVGWIAEQIGSGECVLVHCQHGIGRSALVALAALIAMGLAPLEAMELVKDARGAISPAPEQLEALRVFCARWSEHPVPSIETLMGIAYRHLGGEVGVGGPA